NLHSRTRQVMRHVIKKPARRVLGVFAHPDDAELSAFGTFALMRHLGYEILLAHFTAVENTSVKPSTKRPAQAMESASLLNARCLTGPEPDGSIAYSAAAVAW